MKSLAAMLLQLSAMLGTGDLSVWENDFIANCFDRSLEGTQTNRLSAKQAETIETIYRRHFADSEAAG